MLTEDEAKTKWCPKTRVSGTGSLPDSEWHTNRPSHAEVHEKNFDRCLGSKCMAWRWMAEEFEATGEKCSTAKSTDTPIPVEGFEWVYAHHAQNGSVIWKQVKRLTRRGYCGLAGAPQ